MLKLESTVHSRLGGALRLLVATSLLALPTLVEGELIFADDFESGDVSAWFPGGNGEPCYPDDTCDPGLTCNLATQLCEPSVGGDGDPCYPDNTCDPGLTCNLVTLLCGPSVGGDGDPCYPDDTCDPGLTCNLISQLCEPS